MLVDILSKGEIPDDQDELNDFLERYQCGKVVNNGNIIKVILEISKQELVQKPHLMIASLHPFVKPLREYPHFQRSAAMAMYDSREPAVKTFCLLLSQIQTMIEKELHSSSYKGLFGVWTRLNWYSFYCLQRVWISWMTRR